MTQPTALKLADALDERVVPRWVHATGETPRQSGYAPDLDCVKAAAELRRLYNLLMDQQGEIYALKMARSMEQKTAALKAKELERCKFVCAATAESWREATEQTITELHAQRDALLEALKLARSIIGHPDDAHTQMIDAAIKAVEGEKT